MHNKCQFLAPGKFSRRNKAEREKEEACLSFSVQREYLDEGGLERERRWTAESLRAKFASWSLSATMKLREYVHPPSVPRTPPKIPSHVLEV